MLKKTCIIIFLSHILCSCGVELENRNRKLETKEALGELRPSSLQSLTDFSDFERKLKVKFEGAEPGRYVIYFSWPAGDKKYHLRFRSDELYSEVPLDTGFFTVSSDHDRNFNFQIDVLNPRKEPLSSFSKSVEVPKDFIVDESNYLVKKNLVLEVHRVFLSEKWPLTFQHYDLSIIANEIHPRQGLIQTFHEGQVAQLNTPGRSGGRLSIYAEKLISPLKVLMRGENGGAGLQGAEILERNLTVVPAATRGELVCVEPAPDCVRNPWSCRSVSSSCRCKSFGERGATGAKGIKGNDGLPGARGGNTGSVSVHIKSLNLPIEDNNENLFNPNRFVQIDFQVGAGGAGGSGGAGQRGGLGGVGRNIQDTLDCRGESGSEGSPGAPGVGGQPGLNGDMGQKCVIVGEAQLSHCKL